MISLLHENLVHTHRVRRLSEYLSPQLPPGAALLDVGCGDGKLARQLMATRPDLTIEGLEIAGRPSVHVPMGLFDGKHIPFADRSFDIVLLVDVLHHAEDPIALLRESRRIARRGVLIKDHAAENAFARWTLRGMDYIANSRHGLRLGARYWSRQEWKETFQRVDLTPTQTIESIQLYPNPANLLFGRNLHFISLLTDRETWKAQ